MAALPPPCEQPTKSMLEMGAAMNLDGLRGDAMRHGSSLIRGAFDAYHRQLANCWPDALLTRYNELPRKGGTDDARRQCLARHLPNP
eukprot:8813227-Pyramimonas_sp.AAC.1